jgi:WD40 repeat protein
MKGSSMVSLTLAFALSVSSAAASAETAGQVRLTVTETPIAKVHTGSLLARLSGSVRLVASPDNRHEAHPVARFGKGMVLAVDGQAYGPGLQGFADATITWSPDSKRLAFLAGAPQKGSRRSVILDGAEQKQYDDVAMPFAFSADSKRFAYLAKKGTRWLAVIDGVETGDYDGAVGPIAFDAEGKRFAYSANAGNKWFIVTNGQQGEPYDIAFGPTFSPDGTRLACSAKSGDSCFAVIDGERQKPYDDIGAPVVFSPDSKHIAYIAGKGDRKFAVRDGAEGPEYELVEDLTYSPDGSRLAYRAVRDKKMMVVIDGEEGLRYDSVDWLTFSPDGKRFAYIAKLRDRRFLVVDGVAQEREGVTAPAFSPDSKRLACFASSGGKIAVVVDGVATKQYEGAFYGTRLLWDSPDRLHTLLRAGEDREAIIVEVQITESNPVVDVSAVSATWRIGSPNRGTALVPSSSLLLRPRKGAIGIASGHRCPNP